MKLRFHLYSKTKPLLGSRLWVVLKNMSWKQCRSRKEKKLRWDPLQRPNQYWSRHQQAIRISFRWRIEDGLILKCQNQRSNRATRCRSSLLISFDIEKLVGKKRAGGPYDRIIEKCKEKLSKDSRYWPNEVKQDLKMAPHWSAQKWMVVLAKGGGQKKRFQYCLKPNEPERLLCLRASQGHSGSAHSGNAPVDLDCYRWISPIMFITSDTEMNWDQ